MKKYMTIDGLDFSVTKRKNSKKISLRIDRMTSELRISAPFNACDREIINFVHSFRGDIDRILEKNKLNSEYSEISNSKKISEIKNQMKKALKERIEIRLPIIEDFSGLKANGWSIRDMHTRWGSCNTRTHHINFSLMLAEKSDEELDYVILHELVHTKVPNHGKHFYKYMDVLMPDWKKIRKGMKA